MATYSRIYDKYADAAGAVSSLEALGIPSSDISLIANEAVSDRYDADDNPSATSSGAEIGATVGGGAGLLAGLGMLAIPGLGPIVAAGWLAATAAGAVAGSLAGGLVGAMVDAGTDEADANVYAEAVRRGSVLVTVRTDMRSDVVSPALDAHNPADTINRRTEYERTGWTTFDPDAPQYSSDNTLNERPRRRVS